MQSIHGEGQQGDREPHFDIAFRVIAFAVLLLSALSVLIMGLFATLSGTPAVMRIGFFIILGGLAVLFLMMVAQFASQRLAPRTERTRARTAAVVTLAVFCIGAPGLTYGIWQLAGLLVDEPLYQEASVTPSNAIPQL